MKIDNIRNI